VDLLDKFANGGAAATDEGEAAAADEGVAVAADEGVAARMIVTTRGKRKRRGEDSYPMSEGQTNFHAEARLQVGQDPCRAGFQTR
jgi:hypothetical protein